MHITSILYSQKLLTIDDANINIPKQWEESAVFKCYLQSIKLPPSDERTAATPTSTPHVNTR